MVCEIYCILCRPYHISNIDLGDTWRVYVYYKNHDLFGVDNYYYVNSTFLLTLKALCLCYLCSQVAERN